MEFKTNFVFLRLFFIEFDNMKPILNSILKDTHNTILALFYLKKKIRNCIWGFKLVFVSVLMTSPVFVLMTSPVFVLQNLQRHVMSYIITYYLPSGLFVVVSWISFLIPPDIVPGKVPDIIRRLLLTWIFFQITKSFDVQS